MKKQAVKNQVEKKQPVITHDYRTVFTPTKAQCKEHELSGRVNMFEFGESYPAIIVSKNEKQTILNVFTIHGVIVITTEA